MKKVIFFVALLLVISCAEAANKVDVYFFYGQGCPHCAKEEIFLDVLQEEYPEINIYAYEVYSNDENRMLFESYSALAGKSVQGVPTTFIDRKAHIGFSDSIGIEIKAEVERCMEEVCSNFNEDISNETVTPMPQKYSKEIVIGWTVIIIILVLVIIGVTKYIVKRGKKK